MRNTIKTIQDLENEVYGTSEVTKEDAPVLSTTTGTHNAVYGAQTWANMNQEANVFGAMQKYPWMQSGWRVITGRGGTLGSAGVSENGAIPDSVKPTIATLSTKPKTVARSFNVSEVQEFLAKESQDDDVGDISYLRTYFANQVQEDVNSMLLEDVTTTAGNNIESIDRVCSAKSEEDNSLCDAGDGDIYGIDRGASTTYDAYVSHNSGTDRTLTDSILRTTLQNIHSNGGDPNVVITGHDTYSSIQGLYSPQVRYNVLGETNVKVGVNGVQTKEGQGVGVDVATLYGKPMIISKDVTQDAISRLYMLDTQDKEGFGAPALGMKIARPMQYFEAGMNTGDPYGINKLANEGMFRMMGELICTAFNRQGKIRDLK